MEFLEVQIHALKIKHERDESLELEHSILSKRFNELLEQS